MHSELDRSTPLTTDRSVSRPWCAALALAAVVLLAACGTTIDALPAGGPDEQGDVWEDLIGTEPGAIAVFAAEAEAMTSANAFEVGTDEGASRGGYLVQPTSIASSTSGQAVAQFGFELAEAGEHALWARVYATSLASDATYLGFNGSTVRTFAPELGRYLWVYVTSADLQAGSNSVSIAHGEPGLRIDLFAVVRRDDVDASLLEHLVAPAGDVALPAPSSAAFSLRGDPGFDVGDLSGEQRVWFDRLMSATLAEVPGTVAQAQADDIYFVGRELFQFGSAALLGLRSTGDLRFLDALDPMMEALQGELYDGWCGGVEGPVYVNSRYGTVEERDGFRNFRVRVDSSMDYCRDIADLDEALTHGF